MNENYDLSIDNKSLNGIFGWLIVFVLFLVLNLAYTLLKNFYFYFDSIPISIITLILTILVLIFLFKKNIAFRLLFAALMAIDLGISLIPLFMINPFNISHDLFWVILLLISLAKLLVFTIYLFRSDRVFNTFEKKQTTPNGGVTAFLIFIISFFTMNILSMLRAISLTGALFKMETLITKFYSTLYIANIIAYIIPIIMCVIILVFIAKKVPSFRVVFIIMMMLQIAFFSFVYFRFDNILPMNIISQGSFASWNVIIWGLYVFRSNKIKDYLGIEHY